MEADVRTERPAARAWRGGAVLGAATAVAVVVTGVSFTLSQGSQRASPLPDNSSSVNAVEGGVDDSFTCPHQFSHTGRGLDDAPEFQPSLRAGAAVEANRYGAARFEYDEQQDAAVLRLGNADGSLAGVAEFTRARGEWRLVATTRCAGADGSAVAVTEEPWRLGRHEVEPWPMTEMVELAEVDSTPVLVDDRLLYDAAGLLEHRSIYYAPCGDHLCMIVGTPAANNVEITPVDDRDLPTDVRDLFVPTGLQRTTGHPFGMWQLYATDDVRGVHALLRDGRTVRATKVSGDDWARSLYVLLAPYDEVLFVRVLGTDGRGNRTYRPDELPGHTAR